MTKLNEICEKFFDDCFEPLALAMESLQEYVNDNALTGVDLRVKVATHLLEELNKKVNQFEMDVYEASKS